MYEISPRHAAGIRKNYFEAQLKKSPKTISQLNSLISYSGYRFKTFRDFMAYYKNVTKKLGEIGLYVITVRPDPESIKYVSFTCVATPENKAVYNSANDQNYTEDYLKLDFIELTTDLSVSLSFDLHKYPQHCEITSHTIERIVQRLKTTKLDNITQEIKSSAKSMTTLFNALTYYPAHRWPKRMVIPSNAGAFLAEIDSKTQTILYRTFVKDEMFDFQEDSVNFTREWLNKTRRTAEMTPQLATELLTSKSNRWWFAPNKDQKFTSTTA